ncbi:MAG: MBL fold metallo-hydrolase [Candidatus Lokiarchaeota archaeon]|nr:MBL fold metallo-hydrolase [Candidatus Lokiarchaeota archaeon]MBD3202153.1 MBL fold metallo-hydrolase [Candidatus Lokiarchaeota archaeon]
MSIRIRTISNKSVNCYLLNQEDRFFLIDTGFSDKFEEIENELRIAGVDKNNLELIILTHGDTDHSGNSSILRDKFGAKILMHQADSGIVKTGDMKVNRKEKPDKLSLIFKIFTIFGKEAPFEAFQPDILVSGDDSLKQYRLDANLLHIPGHSKGSIAILTKENDLFCGDLMINITKPKLHYLIDNMELTKESINKLRNEEIDNVYPGHGKPFKMTEFLEKYED